MTKARKKVYELNSARGSRNFKNGNAFETRLVRKFKSRSDVVFAFKSEGSRGKADIIVQFKNKKQFIISCKLNGYYTPEELKDLHKVQQEISEYQIVKLAYYISPRKYVIRNL